MPGAIRDVAGARRPGGPPRVNDVAPRALARDHSHAGAIDSSIEPSVEPYTYRRPLDRRGVLIATGVATIVGAAAFYLARVFLERTPLELATDGGNGAGRDALDRPDRGQLARGDRRTNVHRRTAR